MPVHRWKNQVVGGGRCIPRSLVWWRAGNTLGMHSLDEGTEATESGSRSRESRGAAWARIGQPTGLAARSIRPHSSLHEALEIPDEIFATRLSHLTLQLSVGIVLPPQPCPQPHPCRWAPPGALQCA